MNIPSFDELFDQPLEIILTKKYKTCTVFLSSYRNTSGSLGEREMPWKHERQASVCTAFRVLPNSATLPPQRLVWLEQATDTNHSKNFLMEPFFLLSITFLSDPRCTFLPKNTYQIVPLRWLEIVSSTYILMGRYDHSLSLDATIMVSKNCPTIGEHVVTVFVTQ